MKICIIFSMFLPISLWGMLESSSYFGANTIEELDQLQEQERTLIRSKKFDIPQPDSESVELMQEHCDEEECSICLEFVNRAHVDDYTTACGHLFCWRCLDQWLEHQDSCPLCRTILKAETSKGFILQTHKEFLEDMQFLCLPLGLYLKTIYFKAIFTFYSLRMRS